MPVHVVASGCASASAAPRPPPEATAPAAPPSTGTAARIIIASAPASHERLPLWPPAWPPPRASTFARRRELLLQRQYSRPLRLRLMDSLNKQQTPTTRRLASVVASGCASAAAALGRRPKHCACCAPVYWRCCSNNNSVCSRLARTASALAANLPPRPGLNLSLRSLEELLP